MWKKIKRVFSAVRQYKKYAIITPIFMIGEAAIECFLPFLMSIFIDAIEKVTTPEMIFENIITLSWLRDFQNNPIQTSLFVLILVLIISAFISLTCGILAGRTAAKASVGFAANLRKDLYDKVQSFSFANIDRFSSSSLVTRMTTDVQNASMAFQMLIRIVIRAPLMMIFSAVMAFIAGGSIALIFVGLVFVVAVAMVFIVKGAMGIFKKVFKRYDALNQSVQENVSGIRVVKSYVREDFEKDKFNKASNDSAKDVISAEKIVALNNPVMNTAIHLSNILVISIGTLIISRSVIWDDVKATVNADGTTTYEIAYGQLSIGQLSSLLTYGISILTSVLMISLIMVMLSMSLEAISRIYEVLIEEPTIKDPENPIYEIVDGSVDFNNVDFKYKETAEKNTLENLNIHIKSGQFIGILGSTGSGKTSVVNLISRLYDVSGGEVLVAGKNVKDYNLEALRNSVAVVLQKNVLFTGSIADNLRWGNKTATDEELEKACKIAQADDFIKSFPDGYSKQLTQGGTNVSGGQKQRLCIARAILKKPKVLILDDSTSAVDTKTDRLIRSALKNDIPDTTKIVIAQRISSIEDADQIIIMNDGQIDAIGTHDELLKNNQIYQEVYYTQNRVGGDR